MGQTATLRQVRVMSVHPPGADIARRMRHFCFAPDAEINRAMGLF
jgi:hypothetical protein